MLKKQQIRLIPILALLLISILPISYAGDNYISTNGVIGSDAFTTGTTVLNNTSTYFYIAKITDSIKITCLSVGTWSTVSGNPENVTFTFDIYLASGEQPIGGMTNPLVNIYQYNWVHKVKVNTLVANLDGVGCTTNAIIPQNSWVAIAVSVSKPVIVNLTTSSFQSYAVLGSSPAVMSRLSTFDKFYMQGAWVLYQGATYEDTTSTPSYNLYNFGDMFLSFATEYGVGKDALEIGFSGFTMLALFLYFRNKDIEITAKTFCLLCIAVVTGYYFIGMSPLYYTLVIDILCVTLLIGSVAKTVVAGNNEV